MFESGALNPNGSIHGNDNDEDAARFEPHYTRDHASRSGADLRERDGRAPTGRVTTGLLTALRYVKDNRLLPHGFDKRTADKDVAVHGEAEGDADFAGGRRPDPVLGRRSATRRDRSRSTPSCGISRSPFAGR